MSKLRTTLVVFVASVLAVLSQPIVAGAAEDPVPAFIAPNATWLSVVNYYRSMAGLSKVTEDKTLSPGAFNHSCYMLYNGISHDEVPGKQGYTASGDTAGNQGNVAVSSGTNASVRDQIELWMTGPFHAIGILRPGLRSVGFGQCKLPNTPTWHTAATLDVFGGMDWNAPRPAAPVVWPGNGTTTSLNHFIAETPNPVTYCGWTGGAGLPVIAMMPDHVLERRVDEHHRPERPPADLCPLEGQHGRRSTVDPRRRQRGQRAATGHVGGRSLHRERDHQHRCGHVELHGQPGGSDGRDARAARLACGGSHCVHDDDAVPPRRQSHEVPHHQAPRQRAQAHPGRRSGGHPG